MKTSNEDAAIGLMLGLNILEALMGYIAFGARNIELARATNTSASTITRVMKVIIKKGWARKDENGRFYPHPQFAGLAVRAMMDFDRLQKDVENRRHEMLGVSAVTHSN